jgi:hypothetical protein
VVVGIGGSRTAALTRHSVLVLTWLAVALLRPGLAAAASADPDGVVIAYATARKSGDTEAMLALFADNAVSSIGLDIRTPAETKSVECSRSAAAAVGSWV